MIVLDDCIGFNPLQDIHHCIQMELVMQSFILSAFQIGVWIIEIVWKLDMVPVNSHEEISFIAQILIKCETAHVEQLRKGGMGYLASLLDESRGRGRIRRVFSHSEKFISKHAFAK